MALDLDTEHALRQAVKVITSDRWLMRYYGVDAETVARVRHEERPKVRSRRAFADYDAEIKKLDALSRTRALSMDESLELERLIRRQEGIYTEVRP